MPPRRSARFAPFAALLLAVAGASARAASPADPAPPAGAFVPRYAATAASESESHRTKADPYAVGAITRPQREADTGGKTYGTYQFESYVYADGATKSAAAVTGSTLARFVAWADNPYAARLQAVATESGVASDAFDTLWAELTAAENKAFGEAQERFLEHDTAAAVTTFFDGAGISAEARRDVDLYDVVIGTVNQYGALAAGMAAVVQAKQAAKEAPLTADEAGAALQADKASKVERHFASSPGAWGGIRARIARERALFDG